MAAYPAAGGRSGPGVSQGEGEHNLFREAEKKYQLHWDQRMRKRNGRLVGGKLVERPTDLSGLIDVHGSSEDLQPWLQSGMLQEQWVSLDLGGIGVSRPTAAAATTATGGAQAALAAQAAAAAAAAVAAATAGGVSEAAAETTAATAGGASDASEAATGTSDPSKVNTASGASSAAAATAGVQAAGAAGVPETEASTRESIPIGPNTASGSLGHLQQPLISVESGRDQCRNSSISNSSGGDSSGSRGGVTHSANGTCTSGDDANPCSQQRCYTLPAHPGFLLLPGALPPSLQLLLMRDSLAVYPEPPAHTNHTLRYGHLSGLWEAARQVPELNLAFKLQIDGPLGEGKTAATATAATAAAPDSRSDSAATQVATTAGSGSGAATAGSGSGAATAGSGSGAATVGVVNPEPAPRPAAAATSEAVSSSPSSQPSSFSSSSPSAVPPPPSSAWPWVAKGPGPSAHTMLRKLRWATLGPQFNWTHRTYEMNKEHRPLPPELREIGERVAAAVQHLWTPLSQQQPQQLQQLQNQHEQQPHLQAQQSEQQLQQSQQHPQQAPCHSSRPSPSHPVFSSTPRPPPPSAPRRPFAPDAAIVNYYYPGDTLGGHLDDVEPDMDAPIVGLSLGCDAVFLMGSERRDEAPAALRLRSGDVVILAGRARRCYHGVPRIFADQPLPEGLLAAAKDTGATGVLSRHIGTEEQMQAVVQHMQHCRASISIRAVAPP